MWMLCINQCANYLSNALTIYISSISQDFDVLTSPPVDGDVLRTIRDKIASFIMNKVISREGEFHCSNPWISSF